MSAAELRALADHHDQQGILHASSAHSDAPWYHKHEQDTRRAAEHFAVANALRTRAAMEGDA